MNEAAEVIKRLGGIELSKSKAPFIHRKIERLAVRAGIQKPRIYIIPDKTPNACAVGLSQNDTAVGVTTGLLRNLDENEIEAVLAHEIGHIQRGHSIEKTKIAMKALAISVVAGTGGQMIATSDMDLTPDDDNPDDLLSAVLKIGIGVAVSAAGNAMASSILTSASFRSEFEADESGGLLARKPWALASALKRIEELTQFSDKKYVPEVSQLFIISPSYLDHHSHPPTSERIEKLARIGTKIPEVLHTPTIYCSACGEKTDSDGRYCYWCGSDLDTEVETY